MRIRAGGEVTWPNWEAALSEDLLGRWALNLMLINVSTRKFGRAVRLPEGDMPRADGNGGSCPGAWCKSVALYAVKRLSILTPDRRAKLTPLSGTAEVVPVVNRGDPRGFV